MGQRRGMRWVSPIGLALMVLGGWAIRVAPQGVFALGGLWAALAGGFLVIFGLRGLAGLGGKR